MRSGMSRVVARLRYCSVWRDGEGNMVTLWQELVANRTNLEDSYNCCRHVWKTFTREVVTHLWTTWKTVDLYFGWAVVERRANVGHWSDMGIQAFGGWLDPYLGERLQIPGGEHVFRQNNL